MIIRIRTIVPIDKLHAEADEVDKEFDKLNAEAEKEGKDVALTDNMTRFFASTNDFIRESKLRDFISWMYEKFEPRNVIHEEKDGATVMHCRFNDPFDIFDLLVRAIKLKEWDIDVSMKHARHFRGFP